MNLKDVIEGLVEEKGLDKDKIVEILCREVATVYSKKFPNVDIVAIFNKKNGQIEIFSHKEVVASALDDDLQISLRKARTIEASASLGDIIKVPFEKSIGRVEIAAARQVIATCIRELEQRAVFDEFKDRKNTLVSGIVHKRERAGFVVKIGDFLALLPREGLIPGEELRVGLPIRALLKEVNVVARGDFQLILDRASADFVKRLISLEIPEVFEGLVEVKRIVRVAGYKSKVLVVSASKDIDPVGTCVGVGGVRIKPILRELGQEKIDLIEWSGSLDELIRDSLKPAEIDKVEVSSDGKSAVVWLAQDQRSFAIGRSGQNVALASRLTGVDIRLQDNDLPSLKSLQASPEEKDGRENVE